MHLHGVRHSANSPIGKEPPYCKPVYLESVLLHRMIIAGPVQSLPTHQPHVLPIVHVSMGPLVDYSSSDDDDEPHNSTVTTTARAPETPLPPLPKAFHDLYASTVRTSTADDPSLHHGRTRGIPHVAGQWPSHVSIEWFPSPQEHARLRALVTGLRAAVRDTNEDIHSFLTSDLGAPLPLHISLSRPFVLQTAEKDAFLENLVASLSSSKVEPFDVCFSSLYWFRHDEAARAFLVLGVETVAPNHGGSHSASLRRDQRNSPLSDLLQRCNAQVEAVGQPPLYAGVENESTKQVADCFHVSVAWTLSKNMASWHEKTAETYAAWRRDGEGEGTGGPEGAAAAGTSTSASPPDSTSLATPPMTSGPSPAKTSKTSDSLTPSNTTSLGFRIDSIKVKIGNVVTDIPLGRKPRVTSSAV